MKKTFINKAIHSLAGLLLLGAMTSCEDFLTVLPTNSITEEDFFTEKSDLDNVRSAAYNKLASSAVVSRILFWGEVRSDNVVLNQLSNTGIMYVRDGVLRPTENMYSWEHYYTGINYCNKVLQKGEEMLANKIDPSFNESDWRTLKAEMIALRSLYYFYLVKAYRDVPYVEKSISTDAEALESAIPVTSGAVILGKLAEQLEANKDFAATNFGNTKDNKGRFTKRSATALLSDIYLWRGCLLSNNAAKGDSVANADSLMKVCFSRSAYLADSLIQKDLMVEYNKERKENEATALNSSRVYSDDYPLLMYKPEPMYATDLAYSEIWGVGNSIESIFDIQYDGTQNRNTAVGSYLSSYSSSGGISPSALTINNALISSASTIDPDKGFGLTDFRMLETVLYDPTEPIYPYIKNIATVVTIENPEDVTEGYAGEPVYRESDKTNMCQPVYRLSDVMLIQAEALARHQMAEDSAATNTERIKEGYKLVNAIFARNNPALVEKLGGSLEAERFGANYTNGKTASMLLAKIYQERQREFVGEGKRWFDLVRYAEFENSTKTVLSMMGASSALQTRLRNLWSLYSPIYSEELKANGNLKQNPVWEKYSEK